jgi:hypothetical protein
MKNQKRDKFLAGIFLITAMLFFIGAFTGFTNWVISGALGVLFLGAAAVITCNDENYLN